MLIRKEHRISLACIFGYKLEKKRLVCTVAPTYPPNEQLQNHF